MARKELTAERAREIFRYEPETGILYRKVGLRKTSKTDGSVGHLGGNGYLMVTADAYPYPIHRIAWLIMTGEWPVWVDHIDRNKLNNKWDNLRNSTPSQNAANSSAHRNSTSGRKGVERHHTGKWSARICCNGTRYHLGIFSEVDDAAAAYASASKKLFGEFGRV